MKKQIILTISFTLILMLGSCKQDPIFKTISKEEKQLEPLIKGSPTNFVNFKYKMYVGSGTTLYRYNGQYPGNPARGDWTLVQLDGSIRKLAATSNAMYALCEGSEQNFVLNISTNGTNWSNVPAGISVKSIYAENDQVFIGAGTSNAYSIYKYDGSSFVSLTETQNRLLNGVAYSLTDSTYYLIAKDQDTDTGSTYKYTSGTTADQITGNNPFMGIINTESSTVAISRDGTLYNVTSGGITTTGKKLTSGSSSLFATGALAIWNNNGSKLLLAGRQDEIKNSVNYLQGYQELVLDSSGNIIGATFLDPGLQSPSSIVDNNNASYKTNMEKNVVNYLYQASDGILFAATQNKGVWSYRLRGDRWLWNAEQ